MLANSLHVTSRTTLRMVQWKGMISIGFACLPFQDNQQTRLRDERIALLLLTPSRKSVTRALGQLFPERLQGLVGDGKKLKRVVHELWDIMDPNDFMSRVGTSHASEAIGSHIGS